jgi:hypothetical protein
MSHAPEVTALIGRADLGPLHEAVPVDGVTTFEAVYGAAAESPLGLAALDFFANGGEGLLVVRATDVDAALAVLEEPFDLLVVDPELAGADVSAAHALCEERSAFLVLDAGRDGEPPTGAGRNAAAYHPRLLDGSGHERSAAPAVAGLIERFTRQHGLSRAPAGKEAVVRGAAGLSVDVGEREAAELAERNVNALRALPDTGVVVWGARTLSTEPDWGYVPVRRLALLLERTVDEALEWVILEPNDEELWGAVRRQLEELLTDWWRDGELLGERPEEAFSVRCDDSTMTRDDLDAGRLVVSVGVAMVRPAEFVELRFARTTAGPADPPHQG